jgi:biotin synthase
MISINELKDKVILEDYKISYNEGVELINHPDKQTLYAAADQIRQHFCGNQMDLCSITNAKSGRCSENCKWCSQSKFHESDIEVYDIVETERAVKEAVESGSKGVHRHSLVTSGRTVSSKTLNELIGIYRKIKEKSNISLCASMGLLTEEQLQQLKDEAGIVHYHCNIETAPSYFPQVCTTHTMEEKLETIKKAQKVGLKICSGGIIGMGETAAQRVEFACALRDIGVVSIPMNILSPIKGTQLQDAEPLSEDEILSAIAVMRFINPRAKIRFAGGRLQIRHFQHNALHAGINASLTGNYLTTIGSDIETDLRDFTEAGFEIN